MFYKLCEALIGLQVAQSVDACASLVAEWPQRKTFIV